MKRVLLPVLLSMIALGFMAVVLAHVYPPMESPERTLAYLVAMVVAAVGVLVVNLWAAVGPRDGGSGEAE